MHKLFVLLCFLFISLSANAHKVCDWSEVQPRTVKLAYPSGFGTGYMLNDTAIMTAYHTVDTVIGLNATHFKERDISVMHIPTIKQLIELKPVKIATPKVGEEIVLFGFPFDIYQIQKSLGVVTAVTDDSAEINGFVTHGMSGGAAFVCRKGKPYLVGAIRAYKHYGKHNTGHSVISLVDYSEFKEAAGLK